jgi:DNA invertase Pin-like site-specific DNA recombinase
MKRIAVYRRVSTSAQDTVSQDHAVQQWLATRGWIAATVFEDEGRSGKDDTRPGYLALCAAVAAGEVDTVVVYRLDRLSRKATSAMQTLITWINQGVSFYAVEQPILHLGTDNPFRLTFCALMAEVAQLERESIVARVRAGLAAARARGQRLGRPVTFTEERLRRIAALVAEGRTLSEVARLENVSRNTVRKAIRARA